MKSIFRIIVVLGFIVCFQLNYNLLSTAIDDDESRALIQAAANKACDDVAKQHYCYRGFEYAEGQCEEPRYIESETIPIPGFDNEIAKCCCDLGPVPDQAKKDLACDLRAAEENRESVLNPSPTNPPLCKRGYELVHNQCKAPRNRIINGGAFIPHGYFVTCCCDMGPPTPTPTAGEE